MFKWILITLGVIFLWGGLDNHFNYASDINEDPIEVDLNQLQAMVARGDKKYVSYVGSVDGEARIYSSYLEKPSYSAFAPTDIQSISFRQLYRGDNIERYLGAPLEVNAGLAPMYIEVQLIREDGADRSLQGVSIIAPLEGTQSQLWVLSPWFSVNDDAAKQLWLKKSAHSGRLSRLNDLNANVKNLKKNISEIKQFFANKQGQFVPANALILLGHRPMMLDQDVGRAKAFAPLAGSDNSIFLEMTIEQFDAIAQGEKIAGVLSASESRYYQDFKRVLSNKKLPARIGFIAAETGEALNREHENTTKIGVIGGLIMLTLGGLMLKKDKK